MKHDDAPGPNALGHVDAGFDLDRSLTSAVALLRAEPELTGSAQAGLAHPHVVVLAAIGGARRDERERSQWNGDPGDCGGGLHRRRRWRPAGRSGNAILV
ncbi:MAG: hypothetical protein OEV72_11475, partial [Thermoleophilia bacterium]|nr:hypothetical protein [Thermoleophilia bacterium]